MKKINCIKFKQLIALVVFFFTFNQWAWAKHAVGADLTYQCIGNNTYEISLRFYRDCGGATAPASPSISIAGSNGCSSVAAALTLSQVSSQEVSQVCAGTQTSCAGGNTQGTQEYLYTGQITLPSGCDSYTISYELSARNDGAITNLVLTPSTPIYVETVINTALAPCNNSPQFNNIPVLYGCPGQQILFNHGIFDPDGDSLIFSLTSPRQSGGLNIPFTLVLAQRLH